MFLKNLIIYIENIGKFFVVQDGSPAVLGMSDIDKLSLISFNCETIGRQVALDDIIDNSKRNSQCNRAIQTEGGKCKQFESEKQDAEAQSQHNTYNTAKPTIVTNPMVMGNNNNKNDSFAETINYDSDGFLSELIINENKRFVSDQLTKMTQ